jgi:hypothetical protein
VVDVSKISESGALMRSQREFEACKVLYRH